MTELHEPDRRREKRALQIVVAIGSLVPIAAGGVGVVLGPASFGDPADNTAGFDSHFRYLSGLLLGLGLAYLSAVPGIERRRSRFLLLGGFVVLGGLARLLSTLSWTAVSPTVLAALAMELVVTPALTLWQLRISS